MNGGAVSCSGEHSGGGKGYRKGDHEFIFRYVEFEVPKKSCQVGSCIHHLELRGDDPASL